MALLIFILIVGVLFLLIKKGFNAYSIIGLIIGLILGSSLGVAGGGTAVNGIFIFGAIGFIFGALIYPSKKEVELKDQKQSSHFARPKQQSSPSSTNNNVHYLMSKRNEVELAYKIFNLEKGGDRLTSNSILEELKKTDDILYHKVIYEIKILRFNYFSK